jgi:hypothetical protein
VRVSADSVVIGFPPIFVATNEIEEAPVERRNLLIAGLASATALSIGTAATAQKAPDNWEGMVKVKAKRVDLLYLAPGADVRPYTKVMLDPTEVAFEKNWRRDYNNSTLELGARISEQEIQKAITAGIKASSDIFEKAHVDGGYPVVTEPAEDVLRVRTAVLNIRVNAPERNTSSRQYNFAPEAGSATLVIEARDSLTNALMGRAIDGRVAGDTMVGWRNRVTNRSDFRILVQTWAKLGVEGLGKLKAVSPINAAGVTLR